MDHLTRPFGIGLNEEDEIPCVSSNDYHGVPFLEYAKTNEAYQIVANMTDAEAMARYEFKLQISELERFLQTWLFFGLLQEMLDDIFDQDDFVRATHSKLVLSTKNLPEKLRQWMSDPNLDQKRLTHLHRCLQMTLVALVATPRVFDTKLKIGIAATAEVISAALILAAGSRDIDTILLPPLGLWGDLDDPSPRVAEMEKRHGWCPAQASLTLRKFSSLQAKIYLSKITKPYKRGAHDACSFEDCRALQIDPLTYKSLHRHPGTCEDVEANQVEVVTALKDGKNALLDLKLNQASNRISVTIEAAQPNSWYIALSHVWADGLGNTKENSLPQCQLHHIYDLLTRFCTEESIEGGQKRPYLWLDTLCCPVDPEDKRLALAKLPEVYREASQVLVLDSSLTEIDYRHLQPIEVMSRVFSSGWIFRLWTLNEANLASKLWIQFRDGIIELGQVLNGLSAMTEPETYHFTSELVSEYGKLRIESFKQAGGELWYLTEALKYRSVSEISDEPICVKALLRMEVDVVTGEEKLQPSANHEDRVRVRDERMARLWEASVQGHPKMPKTLIYHVGDRLTKPGVRWAPSTLLNIKNTVPFYRSTETNLAFPSTNGLILSSAACSISVPERVDGILGRPSAMASTLRDFLKCDEHHWLTIFSTSEQKKYPSGCDHMAIYDITIEAGRDGEFEILTEHPVNLSQEASARMDCLLVANATKESQTPELRMRNVRFVRQGRIQKYDRTTCDFLNSVLGQAHALQTDKITQEIRESSKNGGQDPQYLDTLKRLVEKVWSVVDQLEAGLDAMGKNLPDSGLGLVHERRKSIFSLLSRFYRNRYLVNERNFPVTQEYCLD
ncbi:MAG: hypothetical protein MMC33_008843 [Icmadophila ericetorum]|nr:hypothetical protein [Icmadophila ericetorum]